MPPFQYQSYTSPYANTIAQLLEHQSDPQAQAAQTIAAANARAGEQVAQAYGGVATGIASAVGNVAQTVARQQEIAPRLATEALALKEKQSDIRDHDTFKQILKDTPMLSENGMSLYDLPTLGAKSVAAGIDPSKYLDAYAAVNSGFRNEYQARVGTVQTAAQQLARVPDPMLAVNFLDTAVANRTIAPAVADHLKGLIDAADTDAAKAAVVQKIAVTYAGPQTPLKLAGAARPGGAPETAFNPLTKEVIATGAAAAPEPPKPEPGVVYKDDQGIEHPVMATAAGKYIYNGQDVTADVTRPAPTKTLTSDELDADAYARDVLHKADRTQMTDAERQAFIARKAQVESAKQIATHAGERQYDINNPLPPPVFDQNRGERELVTRVMRVVSSRSGDLGTQNARVSDANAGLGQFEQYLDLKTGEYHIPQSALNDLSMKVARLVSGGGNVGVEAMNKFTTETLKGDIAHAITYIGGDPKDAATKGVAKVLIDILNTQGGLAATQRDKYLKEFLIRSAPMELDQERIDHVGQMKLPPMRVTRTGRLPNGNYGLFVSTDGGESWQLTRQQQP